MKINDILESINSKLAGAPSGIKIMTPQQFVASAGDMPDEEEGVAEGSEWETRHDEFTTVGDRATPVQINKIVKALVGAAQQTGSKRGFLNQLVGKQSNGDLARMAHVAETLAKNIQRNINTKPGTDERKELGQHLVYAVSLLKRMNGKEGVEEGSLNEFAVSNGDAGGGGDDSLFNYAKMWYNGDLKTQQQVEKALQKNGLDIGENEDENGGAYISDKTGDYYESWTSEDLEQGVAEGQEHLDRIRKLSGLGEATKLPASTRDLDSQEFQDYMKRIVGTPDLDKAGNVKVDKKGNEKYTTGKTKTDKYKMPYIHRSSVVTYLSPDGQTYDEDKIKQTLAIRPKALLKQNEKMKHSNGEFEQFFNVGFAALVGIALDEQTNKLIVVNTCPGAGSCKVECFAMKGGKIQFKAAWQSDGRILTYLLNDPDGFFNQLSNEISVEAQAAAKGDKKFPNGWQTTVRWHDAGDFFSPEYLDLALKMAAKHPDVRFYAYTKMAGAALANKPPNFIINWSEGANTTQEKQVKAQDPNLDKTKNSRIVPEKLFYDLLAKDEKGNLKKTSDGAWQPASPEALTQMKQRIANEYGISASSILSYTEYMSKRNSIPSGMKYNVIVAPGEGDVSANDPGVLSTLLLRH